eukprot:CAMPEP_0174998714 /NCGR_PEP_ID=MMETSP0005-20121125/1658_1 /TAXON_ID=420556 /ORGANISM="Ochromonas sp., Strain CCMP1393" /LENGTH=283 /DNA_ID=CAMNT_0016253373 /DNA_START=307 /DNA_END=1155 /DNA_ORIENTATION=+
MRIFSLLWYGPCDYDTDEKFGLGGQCNPIHDEGLIGYGIFAAVMMFPIAAYIVMPETRILTIVSTFLIGLGTIITASVWLKSTAMATPIVWFVVFGSLVLCTVHYQLKRLYDYVVKFEALQLDIRNKAEAAQATELRSMIGNVAHDLKTPITTMLNGVEYLLHSVDACKTLQAAARGSSTIPIGHMDGGDHSEVLETQFDEMTECLMNVKSTNSLMTMIVNRCIDYTKAIQGIKLEPKIETISLVSALATPVRIIQDFQSTFDIKISPWESDIASDFRSDKGW